MARFPKGEAVILWCRPQNDLLLIFGSGTYDEDTIINGIKVPVVRMEDGTEIAVHYSSVSIGRRADVENTVAKSRKKGVVAIEWDLDDYLANNLPNDEQIELAREEQVAPGDVVPLHAQREPRTVTDRAMRWSEEIKLSEKKILMLEAQIKRERESITKKRDELRTIKADVMKELAFLSEGDIPEAERETKPGELPPVAPARVAPPIDGFDAAAQRAAVED